MGGRVIDRRPAPKNAAVDTVADAVVSASRLLVSISARSIADVEEKITLPQFRVLVVLKDYSAVTLTELARVLGVQKSTVGRMVERLVIADLVSRTESPLSRRERHVALTAGGTALVSAVMRRRRTEIERILSNMTPYQHKNLVTALTAFTRASGEPVVDHTYWA